jgi:hypothetical protein
LENATLTAVYKADWSGCTTENKGVNDILKHIDTITKACPDQRFVLAGHSQGAVVVTSSIPKIPQASKAKLLAITMFGAPPCLAEVKDKCKSYCNAGDDVSPQHFLTYSKDKLAFNQPNALQICAGTTNPKASGLCNTGPKGAKLWTGAPIASEQEAALSNTAIDIQNANIDQTSIFNTKAAEDCNADVPEKGHQVSGFAKSYNKDAFYTKAAACFIYKKLKSLGGGG